MARLTHPGLAELDPYLDWALRIGPTTRDPFSEEDMRTAWEHHRERLMEEETRGRPGHRPWGWWAFEADREPGPSDDGTVWLAANGHLHDDELAALRERANEARLRVGTTSELISGGGLGGQVSLDRRTVELYERVEEALKAGG